jgi:hypothetical protein
MFNEEMTAYMLYMCYMCYTGMCYMRYVQSINGQGMHCRTADYRYLLPLPPTTTSYRHLMYATLCMLPSVCYLLSATFCLLPSVCYLLSAFPVLSQHCPHLGQYPRTLHCAFDKLFILNPLKKNNKIGVVSMYIQYNYVHYCDTCYIPLKKNNFTAPMAKKAL